MGGGHQHGAAGALYLHGHSWVHRLPAHVKVVTLLAFVLIVVATPATQRWAFLVYAVMLAVVARLAEVPFRTIGRRMTVEIPFLFFALPVVALLLILPAQARPRWVPWAALAFLTAYFIWRNAS